MASHTSGRQLATLCMFYEQVWVSAGDETSRSDWVKPVWEKPRQRHENPVLTSWFINRLYPPKAWTSLVSPKGWCKAGDTCRFTHGKSDRRVLQGEGREGPSGAAASIPGECKFFAKGRCSRGQRCPFLHSRYSADEDHRRRTQAQAPPPSSPPKRRNQARRSPQQRSSTPRPPSPHPRGFYVREGGSDDDSDVASSDGSRAQEDAEPRVDYALGLYPLDDDDGVYFYGTPGGFCGYSGTRRRPGADGVENTIGAFSWRSVVRGGSPGHTPRPIAARSPSPATRASASRSLESPGASARTCTFYLRGKCRFGERCRFSHDAESWTAEETKGEVEAEDIVESAGEDHEEDYEGEERDEEWFEAKEEEELEAAREASLDEEERVQSRDAECGVCLEKVKGKFGILVGCKHVYCLSCIREWRTKSNNRDCPHCRVTSYFVVPSVKLVTDPERKECLVAQYKRTLDDIPCQHFDYGASECPFGNSCFYSHRRRDGTEEDRSTPRLRLTESGETERVRDVHLSSFFDQDF